MRVRLNNRQGIKVSLTQIRHLTEYVFSQEGMKEAPAEISILLVNNAGIKKINKEYLGRTKATDVISFRMWEGPFYKLHPELMGDVVVSVEKARQQARRLGGNFKEELWLYIIHGLLHLVGYEDNTRDNAKRMHKRSLSILKKWGKHAGKG